MIVASLVMTALVTRAAACGTQPFVGGICVFAFNFCPTGYLPTDGRLLPIAQNQALFSLLGTTYGGDGQTTFALPDLRGRTAVGTGQGPGLSDIALGEPGGAELVTLTTSQIPSHTHALSGASDPGNRPGPNGKVLARVNPDTAADIYSTSPANVTLGASSIGSTGGGQPIDIRSPFLGLTVCIAVQGIFPSQN